MVAILVAVCGAGVIVAVVVLGVAQVIVLAVAGAAVIAVASATVHAARVLLRWLQDERARRVARTRTASAAQSTDAAAAVREAATPAQAGECNGAQNQDAESESGRPEDS